MTQSDFAEGDTVLECDKNMITLEIYLAALQHGEYMYPPPQAALMWSCFKYIPHGVNFNYLVVDQIISS